MLGDLLTRSRKQAEQSSPSVRASARMRIARVQSATDPGRYALELEADGELSAMAKKTGEANGESSP